MWTAGIDIGLGGAVAILMPGMPPTVRDTPTALVAVNKGHRRDYQVGEMARYLAHFGAPDRGRVVLERLNAFPGQGLASTWALARGVGLWEGICAALGLPLWKVSPLRWKKHFGIQGKLRDGAEAARLMAQQRWPTVDLSLKRHHNRADALFLAQYGLDQWGTS